MDTTTKMRPAARATTALSVSRDELVLLRAKAAVCDAYRGWLDMPRQRERARVADALAELAKLDGGATCAR